MLILIGVIMLALGAYFGPILLEATPPMLEITGVDTGKTYRSGITLDISVHDRRPGLASLIAQIDDRSLEPLALAEGQDGRTFWAPDTVSLADGKHLVSVVATDRSLRKNVTQQHLEFFTDNTPPQFHVPPESRRVGQGRTLALFVQANEPVAQITGKLFDREIALYPVEFEAHYYNHLSEIRVTGEVRVEKGQLIGLMGATGQVTGPHLHWGMVVNGLAVSPEEWTEKDFSSP